MNDDIISILQKLCRIKITASRAISLLYQLSIKDNDHKEDASLCINHLFYAHLSPNALDFDKRFELINALKEEHGITSSLINIYGAMLKADNFYGSITSGSREENYDDYEPKSDEELPNYYLFALEGFQEALKGNEDVYELIKEKIKSRFEEQYINGDSQFILTIVNQIAEKEDALPIEFRNKIDNLLLMQSLSEEKLAPLKEFIDGFNLETIVEQLEAIVVKAPYLRELKIDGGYEDASKLKAINLAEKFAEMKVELEEYLPLLLQGEQRQTFYFSEKIAQLEYPHDKLIDAIIKTYKGIEVSDQNSLFLNGLIFGKKNDDFTRKVIEKLLNHQNTIGLGILQTRYLNKILLSDLTKIKPYIIQNPDYLRLLEYLELSHFSNKELLELSSWLQDINPSFTLEILDDVLRKHPERWAELQGFIDPILMKKGVLNLSSFINISIHIENLLKRSIDSDPTEAKIEFVLEEIIENYKNFEFHNDTLLNSLIYYLLKNYWELSWPFIGNYIMEEDYVPSRLNYVLTSFPFENSKLLSWVDEKPGQREVVAMRYMKIFNEENQDKSKLEFEPTVLELINRYGSNVKMLQRLENTLTSYRIHSVSAENLFLKRKKLIESLQENPIEEVRIFSSKMSDKFNLLIEREKDNEENYSLGF